MIFDKNSNITINILFGTQTGNAEDVAENASDILTTNGFTTKVLELDDVSMNELSVMENVLVIISTFGMGEMPNNAQDFWEDINSSNPPQLNNLKFSVFALGDSGHYDFCNAGKLIDNKFQELGGTRLLDRIDCDVEFEEPFNNWIKLIL
ncbi:flavodoxin domain-containing protein [Alphaproteobacteria bacterium]|nr:flavodoxin domain-containing protein [Alphaproteobacteria bacterium]